MNPSTTSEKKQNNIWATILWVGIWQGLYLVIDNPLIFASPVQVLRRLFFLSHEVWFWKGIAFSFSRILSGFMLALVLGVVLSIGARRFVRLHQFLKPLVHGMKSTPMASFVILCLLWLPTDKLAIFIAFVMVFPIIYQNMYEGLCSVNAELLEMAKVFHLPLGDRIKYICLSNVLPFFKSAATVALGISWKAGIAAEIIGKPLGSIGENLYRAKIYMETSDVLAWTVTIIVISSLFEKFFLYTLNRFILFIERS